jgi:hypothetical protein
MSRIGRITSLLMAVLREIFDESAYKRFLALNGMASSRGAYARFMREREGTRLRTPRCC